MKVVLPLLLAGLLPGLVLAGELKIADGDRYLVEKDNESLVVDRLEIGDGARIEFADGVAAWRVQAAVAVIGDNVVIDGRGEPGTAGVGGVSAEGCQGQINAQSGGHGVPGSDGVSLRLQLGIQSLGSLRIIAEGGAGGDGGSGGIGADNSDDCPGEKGGNGGNGGNGGVGGNGGDITVLYRVLGDKLQPLDIAQRIDASVAGGKGGRGGRSGEGGSGSGGHYVKKKTLTGGRQWVAGGEVGLSGSPGLSGEAGIDGKIMIDSLMMQPAMAPVAQPQNTAAQRSLVQRLEALERRVKALEQRR